MACPACGNAQVTVPVPAERRSLLRGDPDAVSFCPRCLHLAPAEGATPVADAGRALHDALDSLPDDERAVDAALVLGLLETYALHRQAVEDLVADLEQAGVDVLLVLDRVAGDDAVDPCYDLDRRRTQVRQLL